jgi:hypothetical protein
VEKIGGRREEKGEAATQKGGPCHDQWATASCQPATAALSILPILFINLFFLDL